MKNKIIVKKSVYLKIFLFLGGLMVISLGYNMINYKNIRSVANERLKTTSNIEEAYFAGGCFWCVESSFESYKNNGVIDVVSGYAGGTLVDPTYSEVGKGDTGHREAVKVLYDADQIKYSDLLEIFWRTANPTDAGGQYIDRGFQYTSAIFYRNENEKIVAEDSLNKMQKSGRFGAKKIVTPILKYTNFYDAEEYHQDFYIKNPVRYKAYTNGSGRKEFLGETWGNDLYYTFGKEKKMEISINYKGEALSDIQYKVTQKAGTEKPFNNEYWDNKREGIYVDIIDGVPLYSSKNKYKSGTGWPSFTRPINVNNIEEKEDRGLFSIRTEIVGAKSRAHIGHVFNDGPEEEGGLRYCMNSAALDFIPKENLEKEGYGEYVKLFK